MVKENAEGKREYLKIGKRLSMWIPKFVIKLKARKQVLYYCGVLGH